MSLSKTTAFKLLDLPYVSLRKVFRKFRVQDILTLSASSLSVSRLLQLSNLNPTSLRIVCNPEYTVITTNKESDGHIYVQNEGIQVLALPSPSMFEQVIGDHAVSVEKSAIFDVPITAITTSDHLSTTSALVALLRSYLGVSIQQLRIENFNYQSFAEFLDWPLISVAESIEIEGEEVEDVHLPVLLRQFGAHQTVSLQFRCFDVLAVESALKIEKLTIKEHCWFTRELLLATNFSYLEAECSLLTGLDINAFVRQYINEPGHDLKYLKMRIMNVDGLFDGLPGTRQHMNQKVLMSDGETVHIFSLLEVIAEDGVKISIAMGTEKMIYVFV
ncbi:unnamed protein product [Caenorhabditis sp. 36 PRJEB53466]|nr:unnamed protein product [Caenorhabditis sp. 36 PRJEB53466]